MDQIGGIMYKLWGSRSPTANRPSIGVEIKHNRSSSRSIIEDLIQNGEPADSNSIKPSENFFERQDKWYTQKSKNHSKLREDMEEGETQECTFHPKVNRLNTPNSDSPFSRLYQVKKDYSKQKLQQDLQKANEELSNCTFSPKINHSSQILRSKIFETSQNPLAQLKKQWLPFAPQVKGATKSMKKIQSYLKLDPFERLSARPKAPESPLSLSFEVKVSSIAVNSSFDVPFLERQEMYERFCSDRILQLTQTYPYSPKLCEKSKKLVKSDFLTRNSEYIGKTEQNKREREDQVQNEHSFHPKITEKARKTVARPSPKIPPKQLHSNVPLSFTNSKYRNVSGKLNILSDPDSYVQSLKLKQREREEKIRLELEYRSYKELKECTHRPAINNSKPVQL